MIAYEGSTVPVPMMPRALAQMYCERYSRYVAGYQERWKRLHETIGLGEDFTAEVFEAAESTMKDYFIDNLGNLDPQWADMIAGGTVDGTRLDFISLQGIFAHGMAPSNVLENVESYWQEDPFRWPLPAIAFDESGTQVAFIWIVWHMHWLFVLENLRSISEFKWRVE